jgi:hypothetical protein
MKRTGVFILGLMVLGLLPAEVQARSIFALIAVVKETKTTGQNFEPDSQSAGTIGGAGHQTANLPNIGQGVSTDKKGKTVTDGESGEMINLTGFQTQYRSAATNTASLEAALEYLRADQSDVTRAGQDASMSETGDKNRAGPSLNAAVTGQGVSGAQQVQPNAQGAPVNTQPVTVQVDRGELEEFQRQALANKAALDKAQATETRLRLEAAQAQEDIQVLHRQRDAANAAAAAANAAAARGSTPGN